MATNRQAEITDFERSAATDTQIEALVALKRARRTEFRPDDPMASRDEMRRELQAPIWRRGMEERWALATRDGVPLGYGSWDISPDNPDQLWLDVYVAPEHRRQRVGARLLARLLRCATRPALTTASFGIALQAPVGQALRQWVEDDWGLSVRHVERVARLDLAAVDREANQVALRARMDTLDDDYVARFFVMDELPASETGFQLADLVALQEEIDNLAPLEDFEMEPESYTVEDFEHTVAVERAQGRVLWHYVMCERASGRPVGLTQIDFSPDDRRSIAQWWTGVSAAAQGRGIGTALKRLMLARVLDELPEARYLFTDNAHSNAPMLAINERLGFREHFRINLYQLPMADLAAHVAAMRAG